MLHRHPQGISSSRAVPPLQPWLLFPATCLAAAEFTTFQVDKGISTGKVWCLHRKCTLEPGSSSLIRAHERHLRKAGPLRALSAYARDKNVLKIVSSHRQLLISSLPKVPASPPT